VKGEGRRKVRGRIRVEGPNLPDVGAPPDAVLVRVVLLCAPRLYRDDRVLVRVIAVLALVAEGTEHLGQLSLVLLGRSWRGGARCGTRVDRLRQHGLANCGDKLHCQRHALQAHPAKDKVLEGAVSEGCFK